MRIWLQSLRLEKKKTQIEVANYLGLTQSMYCKIETGKRQPDLKLSLVVSLAEILEVGIDKIVEHEKDGF